MTKVSQDDGSSVCHYRRWQPFPGIALLSALVFLIVSVCFVMPERAQALTLKPSAQPVQIDDIQMFTPFDGWALAKDRTGVLVTNRGPNHWTKVTPPNLYLPPNNQMNGITSWFALDKWHAYIGVFQNGLTSLWRTDNGGRSWSEVKFDFQPLTYIGIYQIQFLDASHGWIAFDKAHGFGRYQIVLMSTSDGGKTWKQLVDTTQDPSGLPTIGPKHFYFTSRQIGWMTGPENETLNVRLYETHDGGRTWAHSSISPVSGLPSDQDPFTESNGPFFSGARNGTLVAKSGSLGSELSALTVYHTSDGGKSWKASSSTVGSGILLFSKIAFLNAENGWVLGINVKGLPILQRTFDGGWHWKTLRPVGLQPFSEVILSLTFLNPAYGWIVNKSDDGTETLFQTLDGGRNWRTLRPSLK